MAKPKRSCHLGACWRLFLLGIRLYPTPFVAIRRGNWFPEWIHSDGTYPCFRIDQVAIKPRRQVFRPDALQNSGPIIAPLPAHILRGIYKHCTCEVSWFVSSFIGFCLCPSLSGSPEDGALSRMKTGDRPTSNPIPYIPLHAHTSCHRTMRPSCHQYCGGLLSYVR